MNVKIKQKSATRFQVVVDHGLLTGRRCAECGRWSWVDDGVTGTACPRPRCNDALGDEAQHRREETHSGFTTEAQARKKKKELIGADALGNYVPPAKTTLRAWVDEWLARRKIDLKASTWSSCCAQCRTCSGSTEARSNSTSYRNRTKSSVVYVAVSEVSERVKTGVRSRA